MPTERKPFPFLIGSDPECTVLFRDKKMYAENVFETLLGTAHKRCAEGELSVDGCRATGELRPKAENTADKHAENIFQIFRKNYPKLKCFEFTTLSLHAPVGGHVHLDITPAHENIPIKNWILPFLLPIWMSEDQVSRSIRKYHDYANLFNFKIGSADTRVTTLEVRSPSAEWISSRKAAVALLGYLGTIWNEMMVHPERFRNDMRDICPPNEQESVNISHLLMEGNRLYCGTVLKTIRENIVNFEFYPDYKEEIDLILNPLKYKKMKAATEFSIFKGWELSQASPHVSQKAFLDLKGADVEIEDGLFDTEEMDDDEHVDIHPYVGYNSDKNVALLAEALTQQIYKCELKPQNEFFIFGLRKGIPDPLLFNRRKEIYEGANLIVTEDDKKAFDKTADKMIARADGFFPRTIFRIDKKKGVVRKKPDPILIGIPYEWRRLPMQVERFLKLVWKHLNAKEVGQTINLKDLKKGESGSFAIASQDNRKLSIRNLEDNGSQGRDFALNGIQRLEAEERDQRMRELEAEIASVPCESNSPLLRWLAFIKAKRTKIFLPVVGVWVPTEYKDKVVPFIVAYKLLPDGEMIQGRVPIILDRGSERKRIQEWTRDQLIQDPGRGFGRDELTGAYVGTLHGRIKLSNNNPEVLNECIPESVLNDAQHINGDDLDIRYGLFESDAFVEEEPSPGTPIPVAETPTPVIPEEDMDEDMDEVEVDVDEELEAALEAPEEWGEVNSPDEIVF